MDARWEGRELSLRKTPEVPQPAKRDKKKTERGGTPYRMNRKAVRFGENRV